MREVSDEKLLDNDVVLGVDKDNNIIYVEVWDAFKEGIDEDLYTKNFKIEK